MIKGEKTKGGRKEKNRWLGSIDKGLKKAMEREMGKNGIKEDMN